MSCNLKLQDPIFKCDLHSENFKSAKIALLILTRCKNLIDYNVGRVWRVHPINPQKNRALEFLTPC